MIGAIAYNIIELINYYLTYKVLMNIKFTGKRLPYIWVVGISCAMQIVVYWQTGNLWRDMIAISSGIVGALVLTKSSKLKVVLLYPIILFICSLINTIGSYGLAMVLGIAQREVCETDFFACLSGCIGIVIILIYHMFTEQTRNREEIQFTVSQYLLLYISIGCLFIIIAFAQGLFANGIDYWEKIKGQAMVASVVLAVCFVLLNFSMHKTWRKSFQYKLENEKYDLYLAQQEKYIRMILIEDEKRRRLRHDMNAHMLAMDRMITKNEWAELQQYFTEMKKCLTENSVEKYTNISAVDAIISEFHKKAVEKQISWSWEGDMVQKENISVFELCTIFSNLLSNAIEAAEEREHEKKVQVIVANFQDNLVITVRNTCAERVNIDSRPISSKKDNIYHGLGLKNVEEIVEKHNGDIKYCGIDGWFQVDIIM